MKIPQHLFQFENNIHWLIVAAKQAAVIYRAHNGQLEEIDRLEPERPNSKDKPGITKLSGRGQNIQSGVALDEPQERLEKKVVAHFLKQLGEKVKTDLHSESEPDRSAERRVVLFVADYMKNEVLETLPTEIRDQVWEVYTGNYNKNHPLDLVERITQSKAENLVKPTSEEVSKILSRGRKEE